jgi:hypothetical protein
MISFFIKSVFLFVSTLILSSLDSFSQFCGSPTTALSITPTATTQNTASYSSGYIQFSFNATAGSTYTFSTCGLSSVDTYLRLYSMPSQTLLVQADDQCNLQSTLSWACTTSGTYSILLCNYPCNQLAGATQMSYSVVGPPENTVPSSGNNAYTLCSGNIYDHAGSTGAYANNISGYTTINPSTSGNVVRLTGSMATESGFDFVRIYDGIGLTGNLLYSNSGTANIGTITSSSGPLTVQFTSNGSITSSGFNFAIQCVTPPSSPTSITASTSTICGSGSSTLTANGSVGTVYWFSGGCNISGQIGTGNSITVSPTTTTTYYARNFNNGAWSSNCTSVTINVNPVPTVNAGSDTSICSGSGTNLLATVTGGVTIGVLQDVLNAINTNQSTLLSSIPTPYGFVLDGGVNSNSIIDGGSDMYDGGNYINTILGSTINYSDNVVTSSTAFGTGGQYFTRVIGPQGNSTVTPTIFYWAADLNGVSSVSITGNNGADGSGIQDLNTFTVTANGVTFSCFLKRVYNAGDPSINQLFLIPLTNNASQSMGSTTNDGYHNLTGLNGINRMYYMLYAGNAGAEISVSQATTIAQTFANILPSSATYSWTSTPAGFNSNLQNPTVSPASTTTYTLTATVNGCSNSDVVNVAINTGPIATLTTPSAAVCNGAQVNLSGTMNAIGPWSMELSNNQIVTGNGSGTWSTAVFPTSVNINYSIGSIVDATACPATVSGVTNITLPITGYQLSTDNQSASCIVNQNGWVHFYHSSGGLIASINSLGQNLGSVSITSYVDPTNAIVPACLNPNPIYETAVMQRHWVVTPTIQPTSPVLVRLPFRDAELINLSNISISNANINDNVYTSSDLVLNKYSGPLNVNSTALDNCQTTGGNGGTTQHNQIGGGSTTLYSPISLASYVDFSIPNFSELWLNGNFTTSPLPIDLVSFVASCNESASAEINWTTSSEQNSSYFELERSSDGINWDEPLQIEAAGNSTSIINYAITDQARSLENTYYRLTLVDYDGTEKTYDPISIDCSGKLADYVKTYPNPSKNSFIIETISSQLTGNSILSIVDIRGKVILNQEVNLIEGKNTFTLNDFNVSPGLYTICIISENGKIQTVKHMIE